MKYVFLPECEINGIYQEGNSIVIGFLDEIIKCNNLHSLQKIIVTGSDSTDYFTAVQCYGGELDSNITITNAHGLEGGAVVIHGIAHDGNLKQIIFIKEALYKAFFIGLIEMSNPGFLESNNLHIDRSFFSILHEFGHAIEYQTSYEKYGYHQPDKAFDLRYEYDEFIRYEALQLWSEYFAEIYATSFFMNGSQNYLNYIIEYLNNNPYPTQLNTQLQHSYRVAYFLVHYLAFLQHQEKGFPLLENIEKYAPLSGYQETFMTMCDTLHDLYINCGKWDFERDSIRLAKAYNRLINYEKEAYKKL